MATPIPVARLIRATYRPRSSFRVQPGLTPDSAVAPPGSLEWVGGSSTPAGGMDVGSNWEYVSGAGIFSSGLGAFSTGNFSASPGDILDGSACGLLSEGYLGLHLDGLDSSTYIQNSVVFTLSGFTGNLGDISNVSFQYGTDLSEPNLPALLTTPIPEPAGLVPSALLVAVVWAGGRRRYGKGALRSPNS